MGTQKKIADKIPQANGDYILSLKANHPTLFQDVKSWFDSQQTANILPLPLEHTTESGHHRIEIRKYWAFSLSQLPPGHSLFLNYLLYMNLLNGLDFKLLLLSEFDIFALKLPMKFNFISVVYLAIVLRFLELFASIADALRSGLPTIWAHQAGVSKIPCTGYLMLLSPRMLVASALIPLTIWF
jgi:hypothetical protein